MGALGLVVGYGLGARDRDASHTSEAPGSVATEPTFRPAPAARARSGDPGPRGSEEAAPRAASTASHPATAPNEPPTATLPVAAAERPTPSGSPERRRSAAAAADGRFAEIVEKLRSANRALVAGRAALALLQLDELERFAGATLREEREMTRVLALCALQDVTGAGRAATRLRAFPGGLDLRASPRAELRAGPAGGGAPTAGPGTVVRRRPSAERDQRAHFSRLRAGGRRRLLPG
jgi:hypothetical protein